MPKTRQRIPRFSLMAARGALLLAKSVWLAAGLALCLWLLLAGTHHWRSSNSSILTLLDRPLAICEFQQSSLACTSLSSNLVFLVLAPVLLAVSSLAVVVLQPLSGRPIPSAYSSTCRRLAAHLLPPRRFWQQLLGGLTVLDLFVLCFLATMNGSWLSGILLRNIKKMAAKTAQQGLAQPTLVMVAKMLARSFGSLIAPNLVLLFYPITRGSVVLQALKLSYPEAIRYHRWVGHIVCLLLLLHGVIYNAAWMYEGQWLAEALSQSPTHNNLMGGLAFLFVLALWVACLPAIRRGAYTVFKTLHHVGFYGVLVLGFCHYWQMFWWFLPGLVLYVSESAMRLLQACCSGNVRVLHAYAAPDGQLCSLVLSAPDNAVASSGVVWLSAPGISWFGTWHPFDYIAVPWTAADTEHQLQVAMLIHMKAYSGWTRKFIARVAEHGVNISVKMQGPYGDPDMYAAGAADNMVAAAAAGPGKNPVLNQLDGAVIVAGGISITPAFTVLQQLAAASTAAGGNSASTLPVLLVWSFRHAAELELLCPPLLAMAAALKLHLTTQLYYTGPALYTVLPASDDQSRQQLPNPAAGDCCEGAADEADPQDQAAIHEPRCPVARGAVLTDPPVNGGAAFASNSSISSSSAADNAKESGIGSKPCLSVSPLCPVVSLDSYCSQACMKLLMLVAAYAGAFCAVVRGYFMILGQPTRLLPTAQAGLVMVALVAAFIVAPQLIMLAVGLLVKSQVRSGMRMYAACSSRQGSEEASLNAAGGCSMFAAAAAAAAEVVRHGSCGKLVASSSGAVALQLPPMHAACRGTTNTSNVAADSQLWCKGSDVQQLALPVAIGRPPLPQLINGWLATLQQLPQPAYNDAAAADDSCASSSIGQKRVGRPACSVYAMGPTALIADAQLLCGGMKGVHFVQKAHQL